MPELSRSQLAVYAALAVACLMLGARWIRASDDAGSTAQAAPFSSQSESSDEIAEGSLEVTGDDLVVHVAGAVQKPGVYRMPTGSRVTDAIERAGGPTRGAATDAINLAAPLADGQQIQVPASSPGGGAAPVAGDTEGPISLGTATLEQLDTIEGIGPVTAEGIIEARDEGTVATIDDLDQISGIGPTTMEALRSSLQP